LSSHLGKPGFEDSKEMIKFCLVSLFFLRFIFLFEREREYKHEGQKEREKESQADSTLIAEHDVGLDPKTLRSPPEWKTRVR